MKWSSFIKTNVYPRLVLENHYDPNRIPINSKIGKETIIEYLGYVIPQKTVEEYLGYDAPKNKNNRKRKIHYYKCMCECGNPEPQVHSEKEFRRVLTGEKKNISCGCARSEIARKMVNDRYNHENSELGQIIKAAKADCYSKGSYNYQFVGAKNIKVCNEWKESTKKFIEWANENGYESGDKLRRKDPTKDFSPENCYFGKIGKSPFRLTFSGSTDFLS